MTPEPEKLSVTSSSRREFCTRACQFASLAALGIVGANCGGGGLTSPSGLGSQLPVVSGSVVNGVLTVTINTGSPLASVGGAALVQSSSGDVLVARTAQTTFVALSAMCTHQACLVTNISGSVYVCPCHGSQYSIASGQVVQGPALQSLRQFATQFTDPTLTIT